MTGCAVLILSFKPQSLGLSKYWFTMWYEPTSRLAHRAWLCWTINMTQSQCSWSHAGLFVLQARCSQDRVRYGLHKVGAGSYHFPALFKYPSVTYPPISDSSGFVASRYRAGDVTRTELPRPAAACPTAWFTTHQTFPSPLCAPLPRRSSQPVKDGWRTCWTSQWLQGICSFPTVPWRLP